MTEPVPETTRSVLDDLFSDRPVEQEPEVLKPTEAPQPPTAAPEPEIPDPLVKATEPATTEPDLPSPGDEEIPAAARPVIERYAFQAREERRQRKEMEQKLAELKDGGEETKAMRAKVQELENELGRLDLSRSPAFRAQYGAPVEQAEQQAMALLTRAGVPEADAKAALSKVFSVSDLRQREMAFDDVEADVTPGMIGAVIQLSVQRDEALEKMNRALEDWKTSRAAVQEREVQEQQARGAKEAQELLTHALEAAGKSGNPYFTRHEGRQDWNEVVDHFEDATLGILKANDAKEIATLVAQGLTVPRLLSQYSRERDRRVALERQMMDESPAQPTPGRPVPAVTPRRAPEAPKSSADIINSMFPTEI
jgi:hypothetical protein